MLLLYILAAAAVILLAGLLIRLLIIDRMKVKNIDDITVLITGCGSGFGHDFVLKCLEEDIVVFAGCRTQQSADKLYEECCGKYDGKIFPFQMDVSSNESVANAVTFVTDKLQELNKELFAIVNNAGTPAPTMFDDMLSLDYYERLWAVNGLGVIRVTRAFKRMIKKAKGRIIICTSIISRCAVPGLGPYTTSKRAASGYADVLRLELKMFGVDVIEIQPGLFRTGINTDNRLQQEMDNAWNKLDEETRQEYGEECFQKGKEFNIKLHSRAPTSSAPVVHAYFHALTSKYPYKNYLVGFDVLTFYAPVSLLPTRIQEAIFETIRRFSGTKLPAVLEHNTAFEPRISYA